ncbi:hypothetical protein AOLI_G00175550 [Acnodon oligacanthus]
MFSTSLLLLLAAVSCVHCYELTQPGSMVVRPGQSLTIDCKVSYSVTDYSTAWIRQPAGKALEWIGNIYTVENREDPTGPTSTPTMFSTSLLLLLAAASCVHCEELTQPGSMVVHPGQSLSIDCKSISRFLVSLISSSSTNTMFLMSLLLLLIAGCVHSQIVLTQSERPVTVAPGGSHKLTCACSGFNVGGYWMSCIRQAPEKGLEWIISYLSDSNKCSAQSVQGRFIASKDSSNLYLHMTQLKPEDTAVYSTVHSKHSGSTIHST